MIVNVWQPFENITVKELLEHIEELETQFDEVSFTVPQHTHVLSIGSKWWRCRRRYDGFCHSSTTQEGLLEILDQIQELVQLAGAPWLSARARRALLTFKKRE